MGIGRNHQRAAALAPTILSSVSIPSMTCPNTVCFPLRCGVALKVMKNCKRGWVLPVHEQPEGGCACWPHLAPIRVGTAVGHAEDPPLRMLERVADLVRKLAIRRVEYTAATPARPRRVPPLERQTRRGAVEPRATALYSLAYIGCASYLDHKSLDAAVEDDPVVVLGGAESEEVLAGPRRLLAEELDLQVPERCM